MSTELKDLGGSKPDTESDQRWLLYLRTVEPGANAVPIQIRGDMTIRDGWIFFRRLPEHRGQPIAVVGYPREVIDHLETASANWNPWMPDWRDA